MPIPSIRLARRALYFAVLPLLALSGCEGSTAPDEPPQLGIHGARTLNALGDTAYVTLTAMDEQGRVLDTSGAVWTSSNPQVATAPSFLPVITSVGVGTATISVTLRGATASVQVEVRQVPARVRITGPETVAIGEAVQMTAQVLDSMNAPIPSAQSFQWSSSLPEVASITQAGGLAGLGSGRTRITATEGALTAATEVRVVFTGEDKWGPDLTRIRVSFSPAAISLTGVDSVVTAVITGEDEGSGIATVALKVGKETPVFSCTMNNPTTGNGQRGTWTCPIRRGVLAGAGTYRVHEFTVMDGGGSGFTTYAPNMEAAGMQAYFTIDP